MKRLLIALSLFLLESQPASAGPDDTTRYLMSDSASMLDIGILKNDILLLASDLGSMHFDWERNRLVIIKFFLNNDLSRAEEQCASWINSVRDVGLIDRSTGKPFSVFVYSKFASNFAHSGFDRTSTPQAVYASIDKIIVLQCTVTDQRSSVNLNAPLLGTGYSMEK